MVDIGGGVPSKDVDIRLGDVVISMPTTTSGDVVQYDYGKTIREGRFEPTGSLNKPPQYLLTALSQMRSNTMSGIQSVDESASEALQRHPNLQEQFSRPERDWLFQAKYEHQSQNIECSMCDRSQLVTRKERESSMTTIHYGLIASGNQVIKNAKTRDDIAQELNILCFEMEAAGLMDQLPCLVIRGICDYCDSHKHKKWQGFAALTAAAYTRALLKVVPPYNPGLTIHRKENRHWMVPFAQNPRFVGRQREIDRLEHLISHTSGPTKIAIHGLGGIGKTQIALELAYPIRERSTGCSVFWIPCVTYASVEQAYVNIASALGISNTEPGKAKEKVTAHLSQESVANWLLIFDNADDTKMWIDGSATTPPLKNILPRCGNGHILFTSRNRKLAVKLAAPNVLPIPDVDQSTSIEILKSSLIQEDLLHDTNASNSLLEQLSFLPLVICQAAAYINENTISLSDYLSLLRQEESSAAELLSEEFEDDARYAETQNTVITTWLVSFQKIQRLDNLAAYFLSFVACINPRAKKKMDALGILKAYSFINEHTSQDSINLHRLVHLAMRNRMRQTKVIDHWIHRAARKLEILFFDDDGGLWRDCLPHALYLIDGEEFQHVYLEFTELIWSVGSSLSEYGRYNDAGSIFTKNLEVLEEALGPEHPNTLTSLRHLGFLLKTQDKKNEAKAIYLRVLESLGGLGSVFREQGKYKEAEAMYRQALVGFEKSLGPEHFHTLGALGHIGDTLAHQRRYKEAEAVFRQVLEGSQKAFVPEHSSNFFAMMNLGMVFKHQDKYEKAKVIYEQALEGREKALGLEHPHSFAVVGSIASLLERQKKYQEAETLYRQALEGHTKASGPEHSDTICVLCRLGFVLAQQGRHGEAKAMYERALEIREKTLGSKHPHTLSSARKLAALQHSMRIKRRRL
ncbi:Tetratricopeptide-like helical [Penicillium malachiteum]|uniref:Tetratricopeptide-like helical n=1 Tax=Penicillium malachiteum TaxID=1324776 RepID=A0AAD6HLV5_9EURO|nr:Tetratricopeptide-like helical [Penicillium malachiteum]